MLNAKKRRKNHNLHRVYFHVDPLENSGFCVRKVYLSTPQGKFLLYFSEYRNSVFPVNSIKCGNLTALSYKDDFKAMKYSISYKIGFNVSDLWNIVMEGDVKSYPPMRTF